MGATTCLALAFTMAIPLPAERVPRGQVHDVLVYGASPDGKTLSTQAIQKAIDACAAGGGGVVRFPEGAFLSGALIIKSGVTLEITPKATLLGSRRREDYYVPAGGEGSEGGARRFHNLIHGEGLHDIAIRGSGTIDGQGEAFRDKTKKRTKCIYLENCQNVLIEGVHLRNAGCWMQHYRFCRNVTIRNITVFNHAAFNNDGLNIDSCQDVLITGCRVDSDDDGIVMKSLSDRPCRRVTVTHCQVSSHCNGLKMGTESGGGFLDMTIRNCRVFSPRHTQAIYGRDRGLAGIALEIVDGGTMDRVVVQDVEIEGVSVPIFVRLGNRARPYVAGAEPGVGTLQNVTFKNITARQTGQIGSSITGLPGHPVRNVVLENVDLGFEGGGTLEQTRREIPEREASYPESTMFGTLPAYGFYCRHVQGLTFRQLALRTETADLRHAMVFDDVQELAIDTLTPSSWPGAAASLRMIGVRKALLRRVSPATSAGTWLRVEGQASAGIVVEADNPAEVHQRIDRAPEVTAGAVTVRP